MNVLTITQGNTENIPFKLRYNGQPITASDVKKVEFAFCSGEVTKTYPSEDVEYDTELDSFRVRLSQEDTFKLSLCATKYQIRICFNDGTVKSTFESLMVVNPSISKVVL